MKKIVLLNINKNPTQEELKNIHRLISSKTAHIEELPLPGALFKPITKASTSQVFRCLRVDESISIDGHDAIVYTEFSHTE